MTPTADADAGESGRGEGERSAPGPSAGPELIDVEAVGDLDGHRRHGCQAEGGRRGASVTGTVEDDEMDPGGCHQVVGEGQLQTTAGRPVKVDHRLAMRVTRLPHAKSVSSDLQVALPRRHRR